MAPEGVEDNAVEKTLPEQIDNVGAELVIVGFVQFIDKVQTKLVVGFVDPDSKQPISGLPLRRIPVKSLVGAPANKPALIAGEVPCKVKSVPPVNKGLVLILPNTPVCISPTG